MVPSSQTGVSGSAGGEPKRGLAMGAADAGGRCRRAGVPIHGARYPGDKIFVIPKGRLDASSPCRRTRDPIPTARERYSSATSDLDHRARPRDPIRGRRAGRQRRTCLLSWATALVAITSEGRPGSDRRSGRVSRQLPPAYVRSLYALIDSFIVPRRDERAARLVTPLKPFEACVEAADRG